MAKYKVGDSVKVKENLKINERYLMANSTDYMIFVNPMDNYLGKIVIISRDYKDSYGIKEDSGKWCWTDEMFEDENKEVIEVAGDTPKEIKPEKRIQESLTIEVAPYYLHSTFKWSDGTTDTCMDDVQNPPERYIFNDSVTVAILSCGCKGIARCQPNDEYSKLKGMEIARAKALIKSLQKDIKRLSK